MKKERESISSGAEKVETLAKRSEAAKEEEKARVRAAVEREEERAKERLEAAQRKAEKKQEKAAMEKAREEKRDEKRARKAEKKDKEERGRTPGFGGWLAAVISLGIAVLALGAVVTIGYFDLTEAKAGLYNGYQSSVYELSELVENMDVNLSKARVATGNYEMRKVLTDILVESELAESCLQSFPVDAHGQRHRPGTVEEQGGLPAGVQAGGVFVLSAQFDVSARTGHEVTPGYALQAAVKVQAVRPGVALPAAEGVAHGGPEGVRPRSDVHIPHPTSAVALLQAFAQVGRQYVALDEGVAEVGNAHRPLPGLVQRPVESLHAPARTVAIVLDARHSRRARVGPDGLDTGRRGQQRVGRHRPARLGAHVGQQVYAAHPVPAHLHGRQEVQQEQGRQHQAGQPGRIP